MHCAKSGTVFMICADIKFITIFLYAWCSCSLAQQYFLFVCLFVGANFGTAVKICLVLNLAQFIIFLGAKFCTVHMICV